MQKYYFLLVAIVIMGAATACQEPTTSSLGLSSLMHYCTASFQAEQKLKRSIAAHTTPLGRKLYDTLRTNTYDLTIDIDSIKIKINPESRAQVSKQKTTTLENKSGDKQDHWTAGAFRTTCTLASCLMIRGATNILLPPRRLHGISDSLEKELDDLHESQEVKATIRPYLNIEQQIQEHIRQPMQQKASEMLYEHGYPLFLSCGLPQKIQSGIDFINQRPYIGAATSTGIALCVGISQAKSFYNACSDNIQDVRDTEVGSAYDAARVLLKVAVYGRDRYKEFEPLITPAHSIIGNIIFSDQKNSTTE